MILRLLDFVPGKRITAQQALDHPFFNEIKKKAGKSKSKLRPKEVTLIGLKRSKSEDQQLEAPATKRKKKDPAEGKPAKVGCVKRVK